MGTLWTEYQHLRWRLALGGMVWMVFYAFTLNELFDFELAYAFIESVLINGIILTSVIFSLLVIRYYRPVNEQFSFFTGLAISISVAAVLGEYFAIRSLFGLDFQTFSMTEALFFHGSFAMLFNLGALALNIQWTEIKNQKQKEREMHQTEQLAKEAELIKLRHQLQPHFLFNSLNSINALITVEPASARKMVHQLSSFLRGTLRADNQEIELKEEIEHLRLYLEIEKVRFGHRLQTNLDVEENTLTAKLPALLVQPLMENAIKFGLYGITGDVKIEMQTRLESNYLWIVITNPVDADTESQRGTGFGLNSIKRRLQLLYGRSDLLKTEKGKDIFTATIKIPQQS